MASILTERLYEITDVDAGCWIGWIWGEYAGQRLLTIAKNYGFQVSEETESAVTAIKNSDIQDEYTLEYAQDTVDNEVEKAHAWMNDQAPSGFHFEWIDGEYFLIKD